MEPKLLFTSDGNEARACLCGRCNRVWESEESAERCCRCSFCGLYFDWTNAGTSHTACRDEARHKADVEDLEKAKLVLDYDGPFLFDETFYEDSDEMWSHMNPEEIPESGFCCRYEPPEIDVGDVLSNVADGMHEDWEPREDQELAGAVADWNAANADNGTWREDRLRKWSKAEIEKRMESKA